MPKRVLRERSGFLGTISFMDWKTVIDQEREKEYFQKLKHIIDEKYAITTVYPPKNKIFNAFSKTKYEDLKVVILGQDPYHGAGQAQGLAFSTPANIQNPPSMQNILKEIYSDTGVAATVQDGDLTPWACQGILLLNAILTVEAGKAKSHHNLGWEIFTDTVIKHISDNFQGIVFLLWGAPAIAKSKLIDKNSHFILTAPHPSPLSAFRGFFGCKHFSKTNEILRKEGKSPILW
jgi:uracil-DNA glycosylase